MAEEADDGPIRDVPVPSEPCSYSSTVEMSSIREEFPVPEEDTQDETTISTIISCNCDTGDPAVGIRSTTPTDFDEDDVLYDLHFMRDCIDELPINCKRYKNGTRRSLTFSNERVREIERENYILLQKIMSSGPSNMPSKSHFSYNTLPPSTSRTCSSAVNRRKKQMQINLDNQVLCRKLDAIKRKKPPAKK